MRRGFPTADLDGAAAAVRRATHDLIVATEALDAKAMTEAIGQRGIAVEALRVALDAGEVESETRRGLLESIAMEAQEADGALRRLIDGASETRDALRGGRQAMHGYRRAAGSGDGAPTGLDQTG